MKSQTEESQGRCELKESIIERIASEQIASEQIANVFVRYIDLTLTGKTLTYRIVSRIENEIDNWRLPYPFDSSILNYISNLDEVDPINRVGKVFYRSTPSESL